MELLTVSCKCLNQLIIADLLQNASGFTGKLTGDENNSAVLLQHWMATISAVKEASDTMFLTSGQTQQSKSKLQDYEAPTSSRYSL